MSDKQKHRSDIEDLQTRVLFQEDVIEHLNATVAQHAQEIDLLKKQLQFLYEQVKEQQEKMQQGAAAQVEIPPHY